MLSKSGIVYDTVVAGPLVVVDTNVMVAAARSRLGASFALVSRIGSKGFEIALSVPLVLEYEDALLAHQQHTQLSRQDIGAILDYLCSVAKLQEIFFLWRPTLRDPKDEMVLELAVAAEASVIVTYNRRDLEPAESFGIKLSTPLEFLREIGELA